MAPGHFVAPSPATLQIIDTLPLFWLSRPAAALLPMSWRKLPHGTRGAAGMLFDPPPEHAASSTLSPSTSRYRISPHLSQTLRKLNERSDSLRAPTLRITGVA